MLNDQQILALIAEEKRVGNPRARWSQLKNCRQRTYDAVGASGNRFQIYLRQNTKLGTNFSCGLLWKPEKGDPVTLRRYNGPDHPHRNPLEREVFGIGHCHIHTATQRYMETSYKAEHYAKVTTRYRNLNAAFHCLVRDCNIRGLSISPDVDDLFDGLH